MSTDTKLSRKLYDFFCEIVGTPEIVRARRLAYRVLEITNVLGPCQIISSGSRSEGLDLEGSDRDTMYLEPLVRVFETEDEARINDDRYIIPIVMDTTDTKPCFSKLKVVNISRDREDMNEKLYQSTVQIGEDIFLSSKRLTLLILSRLSSNFQLHGPCMSTIDNELDIATCVRCHKWISEAEPWIYRSRRNWPSLDLIAKCGMFGVLFVPIGCKGSPYESIEWRLSFSVQEKWLIMSWNHTQLLCYAFLKVLLKEVINKTPSLDGLLCSYYLKTILFWMFEEIDESKWSPDNFINCYMACIQRLLYCVKYSSLVHYIMPDNNMLEDKLTSRDKTELTNLLRDLFKSGLSCFLKTETFGVKNILMSKPILSVGFRFPDIYGNINLLRQFVEHISSLVVTSEIHPNRILYHLLRNNRNKMEQDICIYFLSKLCQREAQLHSPIAPLNNKQRYKQYKSCQSKLLIGLNADAVSGWLLLASFFYVHKRYKESMLVSEYALSKCTDEKLYALNIGLTKDNDEMNKNMSGRKIGIGHILRELTLDTADFQQNSALIPYEQQSEVAGNRCCYIPPVVFSYFLKCLCYFHTGDITSCRNCLQCIEDNLESIDSIGSPIGCAAISYKCLGVAYELIGDLLKARLNYNFATFIMPRR